MATHETFTNNQTYATLLGPMVRGGQPLPGEVNWSGSVSVWSGDVISVSPGKIIVRFGVSGLPGGVTGIDAEVFGSIGYQASTGEWSSINVTKIEWSPVGSSEILARWTFDAPTFFGRDLSVQPVGLNWFIDIFAFGANRLAWWDTLFAGGDTLIGAGANDVLRGGGGNDTITGAGGSDALQGDDGNDTFVYRAGDAVSGEVIAAGDGTDRILSIGTQATANLLQTGAVNVSAVNISGLEEIWTNGTEVVANAPQFGIGGFLNIVGKTGAIDVLTITNAGNWNFTPVTFSNWDLQQDLVGIIGSASGETIIGTSVNDVIVGDLGQDTLSGGAGDDRFILLADETFPLDFIDGGSGRDTLQVTATPFGTSGSNLRALTLTSIEKLEIAAGNVQIDASELNGSAIANPAGSIVTNNKIDTLIGSSTDGRLLIYIDNHMEGIFFNNTLFENWNDGAGTMNLTIAAGTATTAILGPTNEEATMIGQFAAQGVTFLGGLYSDYISGSNFQDLIFSDGYEETEIGLFGDYVSGGGGNDIIGGSDVGDTLEGDAGQDVIAGGRGNDIIDGGADADLLQGMAGDDTLTGGTGNDSFVYASATDSGADTITDFVAGGSEDSIDLRSFTSLTSLSAVLALGSQSGANTVFNFGSGRTLTLNNVTLSTLTAADFVLAAPTGPNIINGTPGNDTLTGTAGVDQINGLAGNDTINGLGGNDILSGGDGDDTIYFDAADTAANVTGGADFDTLQIVGGNAPTSFNLSAQGFEQAFHLRTDTTNQPWSTIRDIYVPGWLRSQSNIIADDGTRQDRNFDYQGNQGYSEYINFYADTTLPNAVTRQVIFEDAGTIQERFFDYQGNQGYSEYINFYADTTLPNAVTRQVIFEDAGTKQERIFDYRGNQGYSEYINFYADTTLPNAVTRQVIFEDPGTKQERIFDYNNTQPAYAEYINYYADLARPNFVTRQVGFNDAGGVVWEYFF